MNEQKALGGKNSQNDKNDKVYRDIAQLEAQISIFIFIISENGIFQNIK